MTTLTREYLQNNFTSIRSLKQTDEAALVRAAAGL